jgi:hypothetical protein
MVTVSLAFVGNRGVWLAAAESCQIWKHRGTAIYESELRRRRYIQHTHPPNTVLRRAKRRIIEQESSPRSNQSEWGCPNESKTGLRNDQSGLPVLLAAG